MRTELKGQAAEACRVLDLDPNRVTSIGFALEAIGCARVTVELLVDDETFRRLLAVLS